MKRIKSILPLETTPKLIAEAVTMGALKTQVLENASTENASTMQTFSQIKKSLVLHKLVWCIFKWGGQVDYRLVFCRR